MLRSSWMQHLPELAEVADAVRPAAIDEREVLGNLVLTDLAILVLVVFFDQGLAILTTLLFTIRRAGAECRGT